jgi:type II secretory pathway pseudopilin PulG
MRARKEKEPIIDEMNAAESVFSKAMKMRDVRKQEKTKFRSQSGLTLCELIIVFALIACLIAMASPQMARVSSGYKLRGAAREVATDLQYARLMAVKENRAFQVIFYPQSYRVVRSGGSVVKTRNFNSDYPEITLSGSAVDFNSRGNSSTHTITVSNLTGSKTISVVPTGRVKLQ